MPKKEKQEFLVLPIQPNDFEFFTSYEDVKEATTFGKFGCQEIRSDLQDISVTDDGQIVIAGDQYTINKQGAKSLCSALKIPFSFGSKIPISLLRENIDALKHLNPKNVKFIINNRDVIVNVSTKKTYAESYFLGSLIPVLEEIEEQLLDIYKIQISDYGYVIWLIDSKRKNENIGEQTYYFGQAIVGDFYQIRDEIEINQAIYLTDSEADLGSAYFTTYAFAPKHKVTSNKVTELGDEYNMSLTESLKEDLGKGYPSATIVDALIYGNDHDISYNYLFYILKPKLKKVIKEEGLFEELVCEEDHLILLEEDLEAMTLRTPSLDLAKRISITGAENLNATNLFNLLSNFQKDLEISDLELCNEVVTGCILNTYDCRVTTPERIAEGVTLQ